MKIVPKNTYYVNICIFNNMGLSNQLYLLIYAICRCIHEKKNYLLVGKFLTDATTSPSKRAPIGNIFFLPEINKYLSGRYNLTILDAFRHPDIVRSVTSINANMTNSDPVVNSELGRNIYQHLYFNTTLIANRIQLIQTILAKSSGHTNINVIHVRLEDDALAHWGNINKIPPQEFHNRLTKKYIDLIEKHIRKDEVTFVLCNNENNAVTQYLKTNSYRNYMLPKYHPFRECNAIVDMVTGKMCNNVLIYSGGSTFSHLLSRYHERSKVQRYSVDLNNLNT